jgi:hypothetical protein
MPAHYFFLNDGTLLVSTYWGRTDPRASDRMRAARAADPLRSRALGHLIDLSRLEETTVTARAEAELFRSLAAKYSSTFGPLPTAILVAAPHVIGLARIFQIAAGLQDPSVPVSVVPTPGEAGSFLGLDLTPAMAAIARRHQEHG